MTLDADTTTTAEEDRAAEALEQAEFDSGAPAAPEPKRAGAKTEQASAALEAPAVAAVVAPKTPPVEYARVTKAELTALTAAAAKTAAFEAQLSKAFGTMGNMQKALTTLQAGAGPRTGKFEIPKDAFAGMERDFPELAEHTRAALEATLRSVTGNGGADADPETMKRLVKEHATEARAAAEIEALEDEHPEWRKIVGQVDDITKHDRTNPFRKWLATKDAAYQKRLNDTTSAAVISRAITRFQSEVKAPAAKPAPSLQAQLQADRIRGAVQSRGDGGPAATPRNDDDDFAAGYAAG